MLKKVRASMRTKADTLSGEIEAAERQMKTAISAGQEQMEKAIKDIEEAWRQEKARILQESVDVEKKRKQRDAVLAYLDRFTLDVD